MAEHKIDTKLITIPLSEPQQQACQELQERCNLTAAVGPRELVKLLGGHSAEDIREAEMLLAKAKIDVNDFFASGNGKSEFDELLSAASIRLSSALKVCPRMPRRKRETASSSRF